MLVLGTQSMYSHPMAKPNHRAKSDVYSVETNSPFKEHNTGNEPGRKGNSLLWGEREEGTVLVG